MKKILNEKLLKRIDEAVKGADFMSNAIPVISADDPENTVFVFIKSKSKYFPLVDLMPELPKKGTLEYLNAQGIFPAEVALKAPFKQNAAGVWEKAEDPLDAAVREFNSRGQRQEPEKDRLPKAEKT